MTFDPERVSRSAAVELSAASKRGEPLAIAAPTLYEFALAVARKRVETTKPLDYLLGEVIARFAVLPLTAEIAGAAATMRETFPRDPFDRLITATALIGNLLLITADRAIRKSNVVRTVW
jgi:PIN domain nuclease of toxin-antitoxin system